jgi:hypothetical protein
MQQQVNTTAGPVFARAQHRLVSSFAQEAQMQSGLFGANLTAGEMLAEARTRDGYGTKAGAKGGSGVPVGNGPGLNFNRPQARGSGDGAARDREASAPAAGNPEGYQASAWLNAANSAAAEWQTPALVPITRFPESDRFIRHAGLSRGHRSPPGCGDGPSRCQFVPCVGRHATRPGDAARDCGRCCHATRHPGRSGRAAR